MSIVDCCPVCGGGIEAVVRVDLDNVVLTDGVVTEFDPAESADDPDTGMVFGGDDRVSCSCRECGYELGDYDLSPVGDSYRFMTPDVLRFLRSCVDNFDEGFPAFGDYTEDDIAVTRSLIEKAREVLA